MVCPAGVASEGLALESGKFSLLQMVGVTEGEIDFARRHGGEDLLARLKQRQIYPVTTAERTSII